MPDIIADSHRVRGRGPGGKGRARVGALLAVAVLISAACEPAGPGAEEEPLAREEPTAVEESVDADDSEAKGYADLQPDAFAARLNRDDPLLVNVHVPFEGEIPGTDVHLPFEEIVDRLNELPEDRDAPVALYCRGDGMSLIAAEALAEQGYTNLIRLDGGMAAWGEDGFGLEGIPDAAAEPGEGS